MAEHWEAQRRWTGAMILKVLLWVVSISGIRTQTAKRPITCRASMSRVVTVTCYFPYNLKDTKTDFIVEYFPPQGQQDYAALSCQWGQESEPSCYVPKLVNFSHVVTDQLTFYVDPSIAPVGGEFLCGPVPTGDAIRERCYLNYTEHEVTSTLAPTSPSGGCDPCTGCGAPVTLAVFLTFILTTILTTALFVCLLRNAGIPLRQLAPRFLDRFMSRRAQTGADSSAIGRGEAEMDPMNVPPQPSA